MQDAVAVDDVDGRTGREREDVRHVVTALLIELHVARLHRALGILEHHHRVGNSTATAYNQSLVEVGLEPADFLVLGDFNLLGRRRGPVKLDRAADSTSVVGRGLIAYNAKAY